MRQIQTFIPVLPWKELSPNGPHGDKYAVADAKDELCSATMHHIQSVMVIGAPMAVARVGVIGYIAIHKKPKIENCPRCFQWALEHRRSNKTQCRCYRPWDTPNLVSALKLMYDGWVRAGVLEGDRHDQMKLGDHDIHPVQTVEEEGLLVTVEELSASGGAE
jgi:hypothetical protein